MAGMWEGTCYFVTYFYDFFCQSLCYKNPRKRVVYTELVQKTTTCPTFTHNCKSTPAARWSYKVGHSICTCKTCSSLEGFVCRCGGNTVKVLNLVFADSVQQAETERADCKMCNVFGVDL